MQLGHWLQLACLVTRFVFILERKPCSSHGVGKCSIHDCGSRWVSEPSFSTDVQGPPPIATKQSQLLCKAQSQWRAGVQAPPTGGGHFSKSRATIAFARRVRVLAAPSPCRPLGSFGPRGILRPAWCPQLRSTAKQAEGLRQSLQSD